MASISWAGTARLPRPLPWFGSRGAGLHIVMGVRSGNAAAEPRRPQGLCVQPGSPCPYRGKWSAGCLASLAGLPAHRAGAVAR
jgi:hypothetical protein